MRTGEPDHTNRRMKDLEASPRCYRDVLGLRPFVLEEHRRGEHPWSLFASPTALSCPRLRPSLHRGLRPLGARGEGPALYVRDPDGCRVELKFYGEA